MPVLARPHRAHPSNRRGTSLYYSPRLDRNHTPLFRSSKALRYRFLCRPHPAGPPAPGNPARRKQRPLPCGEVLVDRPRRRGPSLPTLHGFSRASPLGATLLPMVPSEQQQGRSRWPVALVVALLGACAATAPSSATAPSAATAPSSAAASPPAPASSAPPSSALAASSAPAAPVETAPVAPPPSASALAPAPQPTCERKVIGQAAPPGYTSCQVDADCTVVATGMCPPCGVMPRARARAISRSALEQRGNPYQPQRIGCPACATTPPSDLVPTCVLRRCTLVGDCAPQDAPNLSDGARGGGCAALPRSGGHPPRVIGRANARGGGRSARASRRDAEQDLAGGLVGRQVAVRFGGLLQGEDPIDHRLQESPREER